MRPLYRQLARIVPPLLLLLCEAGCTEKREYKWAFAQWMDGSLESNETCRQSLAESIYAPTNRENTVREATSNIFLFSGSFQKYKIYAYATQAECETALTNLSIRKDSERIGR